MGENFAETFPTLLVNARLLYDWFVLIATVVLFAGLVLAIWRGMLGNMVEIWRGVMTVAVTAVVFGSFPLWVDELQRLIYKGVVEELGADPSNTHTRFAALITGSKEQDTDVGLWDVFWSNNGGFGKTIIYVFIYLVSKLAWLVMWLAYFIQHVLLLYGIAIAPLFLSMFILNATRGIAVRYVLSLMAIILWPLGWALADLITKTMLDLVAENKLISSDIPGVDEALFGVQGLFFLLFLSMWILFSTFAAPRLVVMAITTGSQVGAALLGGFGGAVGMGMATGIGGAAMVGSGGGGLAAAATAGGLGSAAGFISNSAGGGGAVTSAAIGGMAVVAMGSGGTGASGSKGGGTGGGGSSGTGGSAPDYNEKAAAIAAKQQT